MSVRATTDAGFTYTFEDWNLYGDSPAWLEATLGTLEERRHKLGDPARRQALKDALPSIATAPLDTVTVLGPPAPRDGAVPGDVDRPGGPDDR